MSIEASSSNPTAVPLSLRSGSAGAGVKSGSGTAPGLADNFQTFLTLLTTQLKSQNPLDPLNTNQFTQQLVQFAQVEQQIKSNSLLEKLSRTPKAAQSTQALALLGRTVVIDGNTATLTKGSAAWTLRAPRSASATISISNAGGKVVYSGHQVLGSGHTSFVWDGRANNGAALPDGFYNLTVDAKDSNGRAIAVSTETHGIVDSIDLAASPILLSVGGQSYTIDSVKRVVQSGSGGARS